MSGANLRWEHHTLAGALPLRVHRRSGAQVLAARLWLRGGSSADPEGRRGSAQLLAGLLTRGCGDLDAEALADAVEGCGAALRAEAGEDHLAISLKCANSDALALTPLLLAMAREPRLDPDQIALERQLNLQTLQRQREDPFQLAHDQLRHQLYGDGPYGHDPLGVEAELATIGASELQPQVAQLGAAGAVLVLCGELPDGLIEALDADLGAKPWCSHLPTAEAGPPALLGDRLGAVVQDTEQLVLMQGCATVPLSHPDGLPLRLLQAHLGLGMSSRLFVAMREERGLAYDVGVHMPARRGATPFVWHLSTSTDRASEATSALQEEWDRLLTTPLSDGELALAKAKFKGQDAMGRQTCGQIADRMALVLSHGLPETHVAEALARAEQLNAQDLLEAAQRQLRQPRLSLCGPAAALEAAAAVWEQQGPA
ncbi:insulinase family protein [Synechococcus sp. FGCU-3]|nr:insulinase family protein [Synechococcus sp. FGCU3]